MVLHRIKNYFAQLELERTFCTGINQLLKGQHCLCVNVCKDPYSEINNNKLHQHFFLFCIEQAKYGFLSHLEGV